jgi:hypothetical protein
MALKQEGEQGMKKLEKRFKGVVMVVLLVFVAGVSIKAAHNEYKHRQQLSEAKKERQEYNDFFAWRGK